MTVEAAGGLGDRIERTPERRPRHAVDGVGMAGGHDVGMRFVDRRMQHEAGAIDGPGALHNLAGVIDEDEVRGAHPRETHAEGVGPEQVEVLGIAHRDVAREAVLELVAAEDPADGGQPLAAVLAFLRQRLEDRFAGKCRPS